MSEQLEPRSIDRDSESGKQYHHGIIMITAGAGGGTVTASAEARQQLQHLIEEHDTVL
jgi:hypothetical protein